MAVQVGAPAEFSDAAFRKRDLNGDGKISLEEFKSSARPGDQGQLTDLLRKGREDQRAVNEQVDDLRVATADSKQASIGPAADLALLREQQEIAALRGQLAKLDATVVERDAEIEALNNKARDTETALLQLQKYNNSAGLWQERFEEAQRLHTARSGTIRDLKEDKEESLEALGLMSQTCKIQEASLRIQKRQIQRLANESKSDAEQFLVADAVRSERENTVLSLEDAFVRFVGRVTTSLAAGVVTATIGRAQGKVLFAALRLGEGGVPSLDLFEEPSSYGEVMTMELNPEDTEAEVIGDRMILVKPKNFADTIHTPEVIFGLASDEEMVKWTGMLFVVGLLSEP